MYLGGLGINFACSKLRVNTTFRREDDPLEISQMLYILMIRWICDGAAQFFILKLSSTTWKWEYESKMSDERSRYYH